MTQYKFRIIPNHFVDYAEIAKKCPGSKVTTQPNFGLVNPIPKGQVANGIPGSIITSKADTGKSWSKFIDYVRELNKRQNKEGVVTRYKIIFLTRHGLGFHNVQEAKVGTEAWDSHWSLLDGDGTVTWADAHLVPEGIQQATILGETWKSAVLSGEISLPGTLYVSPLARCLETCRLEFQPAFDTTTAAAEGREFRPKVKELLRERLWDHTCDRRSPRTWIERNYPGYDIEEGMTEADEMWEPGQIESLGLHAVRKQKVLEEIFETDDNEVISLTIHSGAIAAILKACDAEEFKVSEGTCIAVLVRGERLELPN